jgi:FKBP-type peptidyl-prolyl cis-trans isomerase FkpA
MKKASLALVVGTALLITACGNDQKTETTDQSATQIVITSESSEAEQQAYALGASMGSFAKNRMEAHDSMGIALDKAALNAGFQDAMSGTLQLTEEEVQTLAQASDTALRAAQEVEAKAKAAAVIAEGAAFLVENGTREGVITTESGLQYEIVTEGEGASPTAEDTVKVHYRGTLTDGTEFDSSFKRNEPISFPLNGVIRGWTEGLQLMKEGSTHRLYIPSELGYGPSAAGAIPPNSVLIFDVELIQVNPED